METTTVLARVATAPRARTQTSREARLPISCAVEIQYRDMSFSAVAQDLSRGGLFARTGVVLPRGAVVQVLLWAPDCTSLPMTARVAHSLDEKTARSLGREQGMGLEWIGTDSRT